MVSKRALLTLLFAAGCATPTDHSSMIPKQTTTAPERAPEAQPMLLLGSGPYYLATDLGYFEADMIKSGQDPGATYAYDRQVTGEKLYTVVPEPFPLAELTQPAGSPVRRTFRADVVRGRPGQGGSTILSRLTFKVKRVVYAAGSGAAQRLSIPQYLVFGNAKELFAARLPGAGPSRRQILTLRVRDGILTAQQAELMTRGSFVRMPRELRPGVASEAEARVGAETLPVSVEALGEIHQ